MVLAQLFNRLAHPPRELVGWHVWHMGSIGESQGAFMRKPGEPLIAGLLADPEGDTQLSDWMTALVNEPDEFLSL